MTKKTIAIIGGGASALMLASTLNSDKYIVNLYEKNAALGRKFLVAGKGGFNLTHSENEVDFATRYSPTAFLAPFLGHFSATDFRTWLSAIGITTYVGTSKRVFPTKGIKPIQVLKAIENCLTNNNVNIHYNYTFTSFTTNELTFTHNNTEVAVMFDIVVFALGGASWKVTGSDGAWLNIIKNNRIDTEVFYPSNCAYKINWDSTLIKIIEGEALKNVTLSCGALHKKGEVVLTTFGIEGSGIYALSAAIRLQLLATQAAIVYIDFKPELSTESIVELLHNRGNLSVKDVLQKKIKLNPTHIALLKHSTTKAEYNTPQQLSAFIKKYPLHITGVSPIDQAISTVGGIALHEVDEHLMLKKLPNHYAIGEMLNWDAPTGGYLLQACFSMGKYLGDRLNKL